MKDAIAICIDLDSTVPAYRQIVDALRIFLVRGDFVAGTVLPSVRRLAIDLGVHFNTVAEAYRTLAQEGWLDLPHGRGATVVERDQPSAITGQLLETFRHRVRAVMAETRAQGASAARLRDELCALATEL